MINLNFDIVSLLEETANRQIFSQILRNRKIQFNELLEYNPDSAKVKESLKKLKQYNLIAEKSSILDDFNTYYITAEGLEASRKFGI